MVFLVKLLRFFRSLFWWFYRSLQPFRLYVRYFEFEVKPCLVYQNFHFLETQNTFNIMSWRVGDMFNHQFINLKPPHRKPIPHQAVNNEYSMS